MRTKAVLSGQYIQGLGGAEAGSAQGPCALRHRQCSVRRLLLHRQCQLQRLLLATLDDLLPQLALVLHTLELGLDVLLRNLQEPQHAVVGFLRDHVQDVPEALRAALTPGLVHAEGHVLRALLPPEQLHVCLALVNPVRIVEPGAWENPHDLSKLYHTLGERCHAMLQILEGFLVHFRVQHIVNCIHLGLPVLLVDVPLLFHLAHGIAVLLDVDFV
mmetsp:Transcript_109013/g.273157  ORF Transcript_109013/g.273157 Transcript_109013/m.273157 type:complete len:216 (+) Transcript_109013:105-752(+)